MVSALDIYEAPVLLNESEETVSVESHKMVNCSWQKTEWEMKAGGCCWIAAYLQMFKHVVQDVIDFFRPTAIVLQVRLLLIEYTSLLWYQWWAQLTKTLALITYNPLIQKLDSLTLNH